MPRTSVYRENAPPRLLHERHRPERTLLYGIIDRHYPAFSAYMSEQGRSLPCHVQKEFDEYLKCGRLEHRFLRVQCSTCHHERLVAFSCKRRGFCPSCGAKHHRAYQRIWTRCNGAIMAKPGAAAYCRACLSDLPDRLHFDFAVLPNRRRYGPCLESRQQSQSY